ncbi:UNVERIFIED_CONTAM: hypothetical protein Slati_3401000 [Sesamum latifolium]|uniref:Ty3-gypsy retrotransposon protein n=1 Tax=Sesamum latifolium TaxID=2727402 RepID=A0AAW2UK22_9LAMI
MDTQGKTVKLVNSKLTTSKSSNSSTKSVGVTTRSMSKKIKDSSQMTPLTEYVQKDFGSPNHASEDDGNKSPPSSPRSVSSHPFTTNVAPVMVINATTIEEQLASLTRAIEGLTKHVQEQDAQIARLIHKADNVDASHIMGKQVEAHDEAEGTIRSKIEGSSKSSLTYSKPYTPRIDSLKMPMGYQPQFQQFDGKGNLKQHVAHFVETCNNAGTYGDHLVKQFVRLLKGNAFEWYTDLEAGSIDGWEQLEQEFSIASTAPGELWRNLSLNCKIDCLKLLPLRCVSKECIGVFAIFSKESSPNFFEELATRAHDMELSMIASGVEGPPIQELRSTKEKQEIKKGGKPFSKTPNKESMAVKCCAFQTQRHCKGQHRPKNNVPYEKPQRKLTLKKMQARQYPFLDSDVPGIFDDLLEANLIDLLEMKRLRKPNGRMIQSIANTIA